MQLVYFYDISEFMAIYEYYCETCQIRFEQITSSSDPDMGKCPKCKQKNTKKLISQFAVGGRGDLRESTLHGCHGCEAATNGMSGCQSGACNWD